MLEIPSYNKSRLGNIAYFLFMVDLDFQGRDKKSH